MKKLLAAVLLATTLTTTVASATELVLSDYSDEEIVTLYEQVRQEVADRNIEKTATLQNGTYDIGSDIPAGKYLLTLTGGGEYYADFTIYEGEDYVDSFMVSDEEGEIQIHIELKEGQKIEIEDAVSCTLKISNGVVFE